MPPVFTTSNKASKDKQVAQDKVLELIRQGMTNGAACQMAGRKLTTFNSWMANDPGFNQQVAEIRKQQRIIRDRKGSRVPVPDFPEFCEKYLGQPLYPHQLRMWDCLRGREPRDLHPSMKYQKGRPNYFLCNLPPNHAKSTTITVNYVAWRIFRDPNVQIIIVSKTQGMAKKWLGNVKRILTSPMYAEVQLRFGPEGGFKDRDGSWTATEIYVRGKTEDAHPTCQAVGIGGHIYGARADMAILDDTITLDNVGGIDHQLDWITQEVITRLPTDGQLAVLGTRVATDDLYRHLRDEMTDFDGDPVFTYLSQPAVLEYKDDPKDWVTLWPETVDRDGTPVAKFNGVACAKLKATTGTRPERWELVYQQADVASTATFPGGAVSCSINKMRAPGALNPAEPQSRPDGMTGTYVIGGLDPATTGFTAMMIWAVDRTTQKRWVLDAYNVAGTNVTGMKSQLKQYTITYGVREWVIERNAYQRAITQDQELLQWLYAHGCKVTEHYTTGNKWDENFGVASMAPLFLSCGTENHNKTWTRTPGGGLIDLPDPSRAPWVNELVSQLVIWEPHQVKQRQKTDLIMAAWFCEIAAVKYIGSQQKREHHVPNPFASRRELAGRRVIDLNALELAIREENATVWI